MPPVVVIVDADPPSSQETFSQNHTKSQKSCEIGETYFSAFALSLNATTQQIGEVRRGCNM
jgi:hypothetical protein